MIPLGSKALFAAALIGLATAVIYGLETNEGSATTIIGFVSIGALVFGLLILWVDMDRAPWVAPDTPLAQQSPAGGRPSLPSAWPLLGAAALGMLVIGAATDAVLVTSAGVVMGVVGIGWLFQHWSEHPSYDSRTAQRLKERLVLPVGLPVGIFLLVLVIAASLSRVFLALPEDGTRAVALVVALVILGSAFAVAASERMARTAVVILCVVAFAAVIGAGVAGLSHGERHFDIPKTNPFHGHLPPGINPTVSAGLGSSSTSSASTTTTAP